MVRCVVRSFRKFREEKTMFERSRRFFAVLLPVAVSVVVLLTACQKREESSAPSATNTTATTTTTTKTPPPAPPPTTTLGGGTAPVPGGVDLCATDIDPKHTVICVESGLTVPPASHTVLAKEIHWYSKDGTTKFNIALTTSGKFEKIKGNGTPHVWTKPKKDAPQENPYTVSGADPVIIIDDTISSAKSSG
jgi:hypothetical protein